MKPAKPTYQQLEKRLTTVEPIIAALKHHEVDAVVGQERLAFLLLKEVQEELVSSDAGFRAMFDLSGVGMVQADSPSFRFIKFNPTFCAMTGYSADELATKNFIGLTHPLDRPRAMNVMARLIRGKAESWSIEKRFVRKDGSVIWVSVNGAAQRDGDGASVKIMAMISDITERKMAEQKLHHRTRELRKLASELTRAQQRERRRIAQMLHDHIEELLNGVKRRKAPAKPDHVKSVREALQDVQEFIEQSIVPPPARRVR